MDVTKLKAFTVIISVVVVSGCVDKNPSLENVVNNPSKFSGNQITLQGEISQNQKVVSNSPFDEESNSSNYEALKSSKQIGSTKENFKLTGACRQNKTANSVKVKGEVKSYKTCKCGYTRKNYQIVNNTYTRIYAIHNEDNGQIVYRQKEGMTQKEAYNEDTFDSNLVEIKDKSDFQKIDIFSVDNIQEKLNLKKHFDQPGSTTYFYENGSIIDNETILTLQDFKYKMTEKTFHVRLSEKVRKLESQKNLSTRKLADNCNKGRKATENFNYDFDKLYDIQGCDSANSKCSKIVYQIRGCNSKPKKQYYLSCNEITKE